MEVASQIEKVFRQESGRIVASLIRLAGGFDLAEEALQDALAAALRVWPESGVPDNPGAWLTAAARRKLIDEMRRAKTRREKGAEIAYSAEAFVEMPEEQDMPDDRLRLIFTCCHPAINREAQIALTLRTLGGLTTTEIARAFLAEEPAIAQRLVRAKKKIRDAGIPYEVPTRQRLPERIETVRTVVYLIFNEGYSATFGTGLTREDLCSEAIRLGRVLCDLLPEEPENRGLLALMLLQDSRRAARTGPRGELVTLEHQDRSRWNRGQIAEARTLLCGRASGRYSLEARIAFEHAVAPTPAATNWRRIANLYGELAEMIPSPVVELNRAVAVAMADGCDAGLALIDSLPGLDGYHLFHAARADLLRRLARHREAAEAYRRALELVTNSVERDYLAARLAALEHNIEA